MLLRRYGLSALGFALFFAPCVAQQNTVRLNQIQVIGTHNSYHAGIAPNEMALWQAKAPKEFEGLEYKHAPLDAQLDAGVRQIELDVYADAKGGLYADPLAPHLIAAAHLNPDAPFDPAGQMKNPGFKVLHVQDIDYRSTCMTFTGCLGVVRRWSDAHPRHLPVFILVETKQGRPLPQVQKITPEPFTPAVFDALDAEILSVFPRERILTPDDVRGAQATLNKAIRSTGWPRLEATLGKVVFLMDQRPMTSVYLEGHPSLRGRILFTNATPGADDAAFLERNDGPAEEIRALVAEGYLIRARTDVDTREARTNNTARRDAMLASGAQILSTDYPASEPAAWPGHYSVSLPEGVVARCNPVNAPAGCTLQ